MRKCCHLILLLLALISLLTETHTLQCYKCQSDVDPGCAFATLESVQQWDYEICDENVTECGVWLKNGDKVTYRGCKTPMQLGIQQIEVCRSDSCNDMVFPKNRQICFQCGGYDCIFPNETHVMMPCRNYVARDLCYTVVTDLHVRRNYAKDIRPYTTYRGCISDDEDSVGLQKCRENRRFCVKARTNSAPAYTNTFSCVQCEEKFTSATPSICFNKTEATACQPLVLGHTPDKCFTIMTGDYLKRGCMNTDNNTIECNNAGKNCHVCHKSGCNGKSYKTMKCRKCDSMKDKRCIDDSNVYDYGFCMTSNLTEQMGCYRWEEVSNGEKIVKRGCLNTLTDATMKDECLSNTSTCKICDGNECNKKLNFQKCFSCDSRVDPNCATLIAPHTINTVTCDGYLDKCFASVEFDPLNSAHISHTKRGCLSHQTACESHNCIACEENLCNEYPVPKSRFMCHQCDERRDIDCGDDLKKNTKFLHFCPIYDAIYGDECISVIDHDMKMVRGCKSEISVEQKCIEMGDKCQRCHYEMCNKQPKYSPSGIFCIKCKSHGMNSKCAMGHSIENSVICKNHVMLGMEEKCFVAVYKNNVVERGCLNDNTRMINMDNVRKWHDCTKTGCNNQTLREIFIK